MGSLAWRIYYADGSTFDSDQGEPEDAPSYGLLCIVYPDDMVGRVVMHRWDWFYWVEPEKQWWGSDLTGVLDRMLHNLPLRALKQGRNVSNTDFAAVMKRATEDPAFPIKSAKRAGERPD